MRGGGEEAVGMGKVAREVFIAVRNGGGEERMGRGKEGVLGDGKRSEWLERGRKVLRMVLRNNGKWDDDVWWELSSVWLKAHVGCLFCRIWT